MRELRCDLCKQPFASREEPYEFRLPPLETVFLVHPRCLDEYWDVPEGDEVPAFRAG